MALLDRLAARKAAFFFVERDWVAFEGNRELMAILARWMTPGDAFAETPDVLPVWVGSHLPPEAAMRRWAIPNVFAVIVGAADASQRDALVDHVRGHPPLGMFDLDADADDLDLPLVLHGFVLPQALIRLSARGRRIDRETGLDVIGFQSDEDSTAFDVAVEGIVEEPTEDLLGEALLRVLVRGAGRRLAPVRASSGVEALLDHAYELFGSGAIGAAGAVGGVAFEQLMRGSLIGADRAWLRQREAAGAHAALNDVIAKAASAGGFDAGRLRMYQRLRNDLAHRLGDAAGASRDDAELEEQVDRFLRWLADQRVDAHGVTTLVNAAPDPALTYPDLLQSAQTAGARAAKAARVTRMSFGEGVFEPSGFAWVTVRGPARPFTRWLIDNGHARGDARGAVIDAPDMEFERSLAWAHACADRLRTAGYSVHYEGRPD